MYPVYSIITFIFISRAMVRTLYVLLKPLYLSHEQWYVPCIFYYNLFNLYIYLTSNGMYPVYSIITFIFISRAMVCTLYILL